MTDKRGNYARHAMIWDLEGKDRSEVIGYYSELAEKYGRKVLCLMCAVGTVACSMAEKGFSVTAVDIEPEMIAIAKKNNPNSRNPLFLVCDVTDLHLPHNDYDFAFIGGSADFHHLLSEKEMLRALSGIYNHLADEGCLMLELEYPADESWHSPGRRFDLEIPPDTGLKVWKYGETSYDADTMLMHIKQEVFIEEAGRTESFIHEFDFQLISRDTMENLMQQVGFQVIYEYGGYDFKKWQPGSDRWVIECVKLSYVTGNK
ncbi:MAG: class I SAM-dependent methyltransferase [Dehalococcoidales bacterium]|nr:MAG: class I SAM-dependent methyltransferase [Dehalococcoidales bacterium]